MDSTDEGRGPGGGTLADLAASDSHNATAAAAGALDEPIKLDADATAASSAAAFDVLERDIQDVLSELVGDKSLERFRFEYEKLHRALKKSHEHEKRLIKKCRELNGEIVNNAAKVQTALKLSQEDQNTIASLRKEIEKAWTMVDVAHDKEVRAKDTIQQLKEEIGNLSKLVEKGAGLSVGQENMVKELAAVRDELQIKVEEQEVFIKSLETRVDQLVTADQAHAAQISEREAALAKLREAGAAKETEMSRELRRRERMDRELKDLRSKLEVKTVEAEEGGLEAVRNKQRAATLEKQLTEARATMEKYLRDYDALYDKTQRLTENLEEEIQRNAAMAAGKLQSEKDMKTRSDKINRLRTEIGLSERKLEREQKTAERYKTLFAESKTPLKVAQTQIVSLEKEVETLRSCIEKMHKEKEGAQRDKGLQLTATQRAVEETRVKEEELNEKDRIIASMEAEIVSYKSSLVRARSELMQKEREVGQYTSEISEAQAMYMQSLEDVKLREIHINEMKKVATEAESKLKQQQQLYESVRSDRNLYSRNLLEAQDEIAEMKRKYKIMAHQIDQLKEEVAAKDGALVQENFERKKVDRQRDQLRNEVDRIKQLLQTNEGVFKKQDDEVRRLASMVRSLDDDSLRQRKEYDQVISERDILGTQLIRRNDELALLYEKLKIQQSSLKNGQLAYNSRLEDIRALRLKVLELQRDLRISRGGNNQTGELKRECDSLRHDLLKERSKVTALSEELENPLNVHRWRKLEGSDPTMYEMIQKVQTLQRRLIGKTEEVVEKELIIQDREKLNTELKAVLTRQPGPEVAEQLSVYQAALKEKMRQMKAMAAELNMFQAKVNEHQYESERLSRELQDMKRKNYESKRRQQLLLNMKRRQERGPEEETDVLRANQAQAHDAQARRYAGGGFLVN